MHLHIPYVLVHTIPSLVIIVLLDEHDVLTAFNPTGLYKMISDKRILVHVTM